MLYMNGGDSKQILVSERVFNPKPSRNNRRKQSRKSLKDLKARIGDDTDEFRDSLQYFQSMSNITLSKEPFPDDTDVKPDIDNNIKDCIETPVPLTSPSATIEVPQDTAGIPCDVDIKSQDIKLPERLHNEPNVDTSNEVIPPISTIAPIKIACDPPYGVLQSGKKPTFRTWKRTRSVRHQAPDKQVLDKQVPDKQVPDKQVEGSIQVPIKKISNGNIRNKTIKHLIGRRDNVISVVLKNLDLRERVNKEIDAIRKHKISDIRKTLKKCNIIKTGSTAPVGILREIYENSTLAGKIKNKSPEILLHNFVNTK